MYEDDLLPFGPSAMEFAQSCTLHYGVVKCVNDHEGRGRVRVEVPGVYGKGKENWTDFIEYVGFPGGSTDNKGDHGIFWPALKGQIVLVGYQSGNPLDMYCFPGPTWLDKEEGKTQDAYIPADIKNSSDGREVSRMRVIKSEAGHTILMDDNGQREGMFITDWTGAGIYWMSPGKEEDDDEQQCEEGKQRKGPNREAKSTAAQTSDDVDSLTKDGKAFISILDLNTQGLLVKAEKDKGQVIISAGKSKGDPNPCIILDAEANRIILAAGDTQLFIDGKKGHVEVTRQIILEKEKEEIKDRVKGELDIVKGYFKKYSES